MKQYVAMNINRWPSAGVPLKFAKLCRETACLDCIVEALLPY